MLNGVCFLITNLDQSKYAGCRAHFLAPFKGGFVVLEKRKGKIWEMEAPEIGLPFVLGIGEAQNWSYIV